jgi:hypothetical protein
MAQMSDRARRNLDAARGEVEAGAAGIGQADLKDPRVVLSLLEADQVVAAKTQTHFGRRELSLGIRVLLWGLRIYVVIMMVIVFISVIRNLHAGH